MAEEGDFIATEFTLARLDASPCESMCSKMSRISNMAIMFIKMRLQLAGHPCRQKGSKPRITQSMNRYNV